jgi:DNA-binding LytR/AlgR family response regulator
MPRVKTIILDDEPHWQVVLRRMAEAHPQLEVTGTYGSAQDALNAIAMDRPQLILSDIEMAEINGIELIRSMESPPYVVFVTTHEQFAVDSYQVDAVDYLVKPVTVARFERAINKVIKRMQPSEVSDLDNGTLIDHSDNDVISFFFIKDQNTFVKINCEDILFIKSLENYIQIFTDKGAFTTLATLSYIESRLGPSFMRVHRSYIVNLEKVETFTTEDIRFGQHEVPLGGQYQEQFKTNFVQKNLLKK